MDPSACLRRIIEASKSRETRMEYEEACEDLAAWLAGGGFKPAIPEGMKYIPGTGTAWAIWSPIAGGDAVWALVRFSVTGTVQEAYALA
jgi:hypothetical protein